MDWADFWTKLAGGLIGSLVGGSLIAWINGYYSKRGERAAIREFLPDILKEEHGKAYQQERGKRLATNEDMENVLRQISATTDATKRIEARVSNESWRGERRAELQLEAIKSILTLVSELQANFIEDETHGPSNGVVHLFRCKERRSEGII
jgi:hypothetical protein